jgi:hypothetical protein
VERCNHMTCKQCGHHFCWICMGPWSAHGEATGTTVVHGSFISPPAPPVITLPSTLLPTTLPPPHHD